MEVQASIAAVLFLKLLQHISNDGSNLQSNEDKQKISS